MVFIPDKGYAVFSKVKVGMLFLRSGPGVKTIFTLLILVRDVFADLFYGGFETRRRRGVEFLWLCGISGIAFLHEAILYCHSFLVFFHYFIFDETIGDHLNEPSETI